VGACRWQKKKKPVGACRMTLHRPSARQLATVQSRGSRVRTHAQRSLYFPASYTRNRHGKTKEKETQSNQAFPRSA
jgi:hypothetical protein